MSKFNDGDKVSVDKTGRLWQGVCEVRNGRRDSDGEIQVWYSNHSDWSYVAEHLCTLAEPKAPLGTLEAVLEASDKVLAVDIESSIPVAPQIETQLNQEGNSNMANVTRNIIKVMLIDQDAGLDVSKSLVHDFGEHVVEGSIEDLKMQLAADNDINAILAKHNAVRVKETNIDILNRTGNKAKLLPRKLNEMTWKTQVVA